MGPLFRSRRMLVGADDRAIDKVDLPRELPLRVGLLLDRRQDTIPVPGFPPAIEPTVDRAPGAVALGQVPPGGTGAEDPENAIGDPAILGAVAALLLVGRQHRLQAPPLFFG